jgi:L-amino acid N-acyltransferase YncA
MVIKNLYPLPVPIINIPNHYSHMGLIVRDFSPQDLPAVIETYRDANNTLRESRGGIHPDHTIDRIVNLPDEKLAPMLTRGAVVLVAEHGGEIAGFTAFSNSFTDRLLRTTYGKSLYVKEKFQRGKAGVSVGKELMLARKRKLQSLGFRKYYSYSVPESVGFQKKFGAKFYPFHDTYSLNKSVRMRYFDVEIKPSALNRLRVEPFIFELNCLIWRLRGGRA